MNYRFAFPIDINFSSCCLPSEIFNYRSCIIYTKGSTIIVLSVSLLQESIQTLINLFLTSLNSATTLLYCTFFKNNVWRKDCYASCYVKQLSFNSNIFKRCRQTDPSYLPTAQVSGVCFFWEGCGICLTSEQCDSWNCVPALLHTYIICSWSRAATPMQPNRGSDQRAKEAMNVEERK